MIRRLIHAACLALLTPLAALAQERDAAKLYVFGNSLVHHLGDEEHANVPHWMGELARAGGYGFALDGQWGFLRDFARSLPPRPNWTIPGVTGSWDAGRGAFGDAGFDAIWITPANFVQYQAPDAPYDYDNAAGESPMGVILQIVDWMQGRSPGMPVYLYEGWSEMNSVSRRFPPSVRNARAYHALNQAEYHDWYETLLDDLRAARPKADIRLIPVARILSALLGEGGPLEEVPAEALYVDLDPHGTPSLYFLAAMITYAATYGEAPPAGYTPASSLHPAIAAAYPELAARVWDEVSASGVLESAGLAPELSTTRSAEAAPTPAPAPAVEPLPQRGEVALPASGARPEGAPALAMGLNGISDWSTQAPFLDHMKMAREWIGHLPGQWGGVEAEELRAEGALDEDGWPKYIPERVERLEALLLTDQPSEAQYLTGTYRVFWQGKGKLDITGRASRVRLGEGEGQFWYSPGEGAVGVSISATDAEDPIRDVRIVREDQLALHEAGALFNPLWLARIGDLRSLRFMDWMMTNGSPVQRWDDRPRMSDYTWSAWGVPAEVMIRLANRVGADPWFNIPHMADDDYVRRFAELVTARLDPGLKAYVEYSNEVWNFIFPQARWAEAQADALWGRSEAGWMQYYGLRSAQVMQIFTEVFGDEVPERLVRVISTHTGWPGLEENILMAPLAYLQLGHPPQDVFDAYAVAGYFGYEMGGEEMAPQLDDWLARSEAAAVAAGEAEGLRRVALREYVREHRFDAAVAPVALALLEGSLKELIEEIFPYHASVAEAAGLRLVMYEGGTHVSAQMERVSESALAEFFTYFNYTPEIAKLYEELLAGWVASGGALFNAFVDVAPASQWGSWGALRHLGDDNPRWDMLMSYNATAPTDWEPRAPGVFDGGLLLEAGDGGETLEGSPKPDILLGGAGDDRLIGGGGDDLLHGGAGRDIAVLPGGQGAYAFSREEGGRLVAAGPQGIVRMVQVEALGFADAPGVALPTAGL
ncbi:calcium-binding protein [Salipiger bermudensis]|uniref:calcium-binding protein n=1 Tax=Salipiger bermudensis TaxID=344736 RepID=UPI001C996A57|nr:calcium-binding protein [Salipiger bermudensis]MBY6004042.1 calcium-binding protein [Salipiger bermudensis]